VVDVIYDIASNFADGLDPNSLMADLRDRLGGDFSSSSAGATGGYDATKGYVTGEFVITYSRALTAPEAQEVVDCFSAHGGTGGSDPNVPIIANLPPASTHAGQIVWCSDSARVSSGTGCPVYSDGVDWRRVSDDTVMREG
jgi:hypothetical protein